MASKVAEIAEAVKDFLNDDARGFSQAFAATRRYAPLENYEDLQEIDVAVVGSNRSRSWAAQWASRSKSGKSTPIYVFVVKRLSQASDPATPAANTEIDALLALCEEIDDSFLTGPFASTGASLSPDESTITVDAEALKQKLFFAVITLPFIYI
jgi:hypothetical protein